jgi:hypothetical protein
MSDDEYVDNDCSCCQECCECGYCTESCDCECLCYYWKDIQ